MPGAQKKKAQGGANTVPVKKGNVTRSKQASQPARKKAPEPKKKASGSKKKNTGSKTAPHVQPEGESGVGGGVRLDQPVTTTPPQVGGDVRQQQPPVPTEPANNQDHQSSDNSSETTGLVQQQSGQVEVLLKEKMLLQVKEKTLRSRISVVRRQLESEDLDPALKKQLSDSLIKDELELIEITDRLETLRVNIMFLMFPEDMIPTTPTSRQQHRLNSPRPSSSNASTPTTTSVNSESHITVDQNDPMSSLVSALTTAFTRVNSNNSMELFLARQVQGWQLPEFGGDHDDFLLFITTYEHSTEYCKFTNVDNHARLLNSLKGEALESVEQMMLDPGNVPNIIEQLKLQYGRKGVIIERMIQKLEEHPRVTHNRTWIPFGIAVNNLVSTIKKSGELNIMSSPGLVRKLVYKLPANKQMDWEKYCIRSRKEFPSLEDFWGWIQPSYQAAFNIRPQEEESSGKEKKKEEKKKEQGRKGKKNWKKDTVMVAATVSDNNSAQKRKFDKSESSTDSSGKKRFMECVFCKGAHRPWNCNEFKKETPEQRKKLAQKHGTCFGCLYPGHYTNNCRSKRECGMNGCKDSHNKLLHIEDASKPASKVKVGSQASGSQGESSEKESSMVTCEKASKINFYVFPVYVRRGDGGLQEVFIALDSFSSITAMSEKAARELGLSGDKTDLTVQGFQEETTIENCENLELEVISKLDGEVYKMKNVKKVPSLTLPSQSVSKEVLRTFAHLKGIPLEAYSHVAPTILVGQDNYLLHLQKEVKVGKVGEPVAVKTMLGWALVGPTSASTSAFSYHIEEKNEDRLHELVKYYFTTESFGIKPRLETLQSKENERAQSILDSTLRRKGDGWETGLLWKYDDFQFPKSKNYAFTRLRGMERKMDSNENFASNYKLRIEEYLEKGFVKKLSPEEAAVEGPHTFYLPHFMVTNPKKPNKYRLVFDAAAKVEGKSFNDFLIPGPDKLVSLPGTLLKFRQRKVGLCGDIMDMFHRVHVKPEDSCSQRFLFRGMDRDNAPDVYEIVVLFFGATCSPVCAQEAKNKNAEEFKNQFPYAYYAIKNLHFVDDYMHCFDSTKEATQAQQDVSEVHKRGSFHIRNWLSNEMDVMAAIPEDDQGKTMKDLTDKQADVILERVLGLFWLLGEDSFTFLLKHLKAKEDILSGEKIPTKRQVLSLVMSLFDPLGFLATLTVKAKIILQQMWRQKTGWDDELSANLLESWKAWLFNLRNIQSFKIPRCYHPSFSTANLQLHIFVDGSEESFGAVGYFRGEKEGKLFVALVAAKTKVAPLKPLSIPRLELQAAVMGSRLAAFIEEETEIPIQRKVFWSDSMTVLKWLRDDGRKYKQFVAVRIGEIQDTTNVSQWHYVPTALNVADELTRLRGDCDWSPQSRWINGPSFLQQSEEQWPTEPTENPVEEDEEVKKTCLMSTQVSPLFDVNRFARYTNLIRCTAFVFRFLHKSCDREKGELAVNELEKAKNWWYEKAQADSFGAELDLLQKRNDIASDNAQQQNLFPKSSKLHRLNVSLDGKLMKIAGRLENSTLPIETKRPIILDAAHPFVKKLIQHFHEKMGHRGISATINEIRQQFFIIGLLRAIKNLKNSCQFCKLKKSWPAPPLMGQLPSYRLDAFVPAFCNTGLDYFGPIQVTIGRRTEKRWVGLFTCLSTRAVHLDIVNSLNTDSCIMLLQRFFAQKGACRKIYSDNGSSFKGANTELQKALVELDQDRIKSTCSLVGVVWRFLPSYSPHMGGSWESMVKAVKQAMGEILYSKNLREETLRTVLAVAAHDVNSHPLTDVSVDPEDDETLTPNHFLLFRSNNLQPVGEVTEFDLYGRKQWKMVQNLQQQFWNKWVKSYLPTLLRRKKWLKPTKPIEEDDIVQEIDPAVPRHQWKRGRVIKLYPGKDNIVRVVDLITPDRKVFRRSVAKLCILDVQKPPNQ